ncbi:DEAD/DEAH box helicase [uncultured Paraglaciecola sp.]|uniref:DEAD/DEAH box helicase n=1 Tax=uncultured Paraglaciecola sp. TaxID=1765024 RepID=UPI002598440B|nr:DEAD/DEAH box helicase [uncultured Paraglaciecola sp.]
MSFVDLGLCDVLSKTAENLGYFSPTQVQRKSIPLVLKGEDLVVISETGSGKTGAFAWPILQLMSASQVVLPKNIRSLVITPTRELAAQVTKSFQVYGCDLNLNITGVYGGMRIEPQIAKLRDGVDVLVATPGRLLDLYRQQAVNFQQLETLVLDEADRMLELGFIDDISKIQKHLPKKYQTLMFSATFSKEITSLATGLLNQPNVIEVNKVNSTVSNIKQLIHPVDKNNKAKLLSHLLNKHQWRQVIVFISTKHGADLLVQKLETSGVNVASIHANRSQHARVQVLGDFINGKLSVLVATDIASRGIDISQLPCVINFDLPFVAEDYVHRIGRTGRAGASGMAITLFSEEESKQLLSIENFIGQKLQRELVSGFAPSKKKPKISQKESDNDLYGNFEAHSKPFKGRNNKTSNRNRRK